MILVISTDLMLKKASLNLLPKFLLGNTQKELLLPLAYLTNFRLCGLKSLHVYLKIFSKLYCNLNTRGFVNDLQISPSSRNDKRLKEMIKEKVFSLTTNLATFLPLPYTFIRWVKHVLKYRSDFLRYY